MSPTTPSKRSGALEWIKSHGTLPLFLAMLVYIVIIALIEPKFASFANLKNVMLQVSVAGIVTLGMTMLIISGGIDLSVGFLISFVCCVMAKMLLAGTSELVTIVTGIGLCIGLQAIVGFVISRTRVEPFILTLGTYSIFKGTALLVTGGSNIPLVDQFETVGSSSVAGVPLPICLFLGLCITLGLVFRYTVFGRQLFAVGENSETAFLVGINVKNFKLKVYAINGIFLGIAAVVLLSRVGSGGSEVGAGLELDSIAAAVVGGAALSGGKGSAMGAFIGVVFLGMIRNSLTMVGVDAYWQDVTVGAIIALAVVISSLKKSNRTSH
ncbi:MAG: ribose/xylose/arabinose/galactoside ABC-type transport system permease subunit [Rhodothermales bacterium]|jgi:ribose/xylose/arabinose/galactoside ABC-type transport system permease subunit